MSEHFDNNTFNAFVFDSPIDFVLIGLVRGKEQVLIKSRDLDLDLLGWYQNFKNIENSRFIESFSSFILPAQTNNQLIDVDWKGSLSMNKFIDEKRMYNIVLVWKAKSKKSQNANEAIRKELQRRIPDIMYALDKRDRNLLEWNIAPVISLCNYFSEKSVRSQNSYLIILGLYLIVAIIVIMIVLNRMRFFQ